MKKGEHATPDGGERGGGWEESLCKGSSTHEPREQNGEGGGQKKGLLETDFA